MFLIRGEQRAAMRKLKKVLLKMVRWDNGISTLSPASKLTRTPFLDPHNGPPSWQAFALALVDVIDQQLERTGTFQLVEVES